MTQLDTAPARPGRKRDHTRDPEILNAALDVLAETGYDRMTVDMVATRAKAGKATLYRRWPSKAELVIDAVACLKVGDRDAPLPDTGSLREDLVSQIKPHSIDDGQRKLRIMTGLASMLSTSPELARTANETIVRPRIERNLALFERAVERGEIEPGLDLELIAGLSTALAANRMLLEGKPVDRDFLVGVIDAVVLPALGIRADIPA
ncbi:TetR/AcrR family transcriptional regulator [Agromyces seonyuensis]|uniref:TetR family transcriptional regulator n=1 Tax=Agromyces seonyuensis TaxID=2662446 RepID=A0A6I4NXI4_9MICO|nr:TetR/AcrR family transcriptional regulator [Agromyces seonyuensis]MWB98958.1 TetR family transcriptional regulator [Agromyces seonyuensis]